MIVSKPNITSREISALMLELGDYVTARQLTDILQVRYPDHQVQQASVYNRCLEFSTSANAVCHCQSGRPHKFRLISIKEKYFRHMKTRLAMDVNKPRKKRQRPDEYVPMMHMLDRLLRNVRKSA
ncbi:MAG TPA: hypothetical protein VGL07_16850 [Buttiauxella sp.]